MEKSASFGDTRSLGMKSIKFSSKVVEKAHSENQDRAATIANPVLTDVDIDMREVYFLILQLLSDGPCQRTFELLWDEAIEHHLLPRRYHAWYSRSGAHTRHDSDNGVSIPLSYNNLVDRYPHIEKDHLLKLLKQLTLNTARSLQGSGRGNPPTAADVPTLLGSSSFSLLKCDRDKANTQVKLPQSYLRWPHMQAGQLHGLALREIGGGFVKHHCSPSIRSACYVIAKPLTMVEKMQNIKKLRGHRDAVYCAILDHSGRYLITGSDDRLVKIWSMETAFCLASCRGHEGDITDLAVSSNNALVASASNDFNIRVWRLADGFPVSVLRGHTGAVTAIAFSPRPCTLYHLLSSSDDGTCRMWDARSSEGSSQVYTPKPLDAVAGRSTGTSSNGPFVSNGPPIHQILCCAYNATGTVFVTGSSDTHARVWIACNLNKDESGQPIHEIDVLAGHENDVNYVQFSGCAVASKSSISESTKDDKLSKFKNSWFSHDSIVTCSRDGSAIIWIPKSRRSHGKPRGWTRAYHLKVPPPPMPPQPPRGGPRQRLLPTPRGVNMIVWSLDNRFVLAAIMDCRICVWNAADGSLVHSLAGHDASTYVLDVHPFNPRIAMSAGYDGKTIVWDIWEGKPVKVYEIGRFKLVDGKFSPDGTSIVLSDDVGQIYLLSTGQGESQKDAKYDQFFLGDYRPLIRDSHGYALDQETQLVPYKRNMEDLLCDSSMIPYPEPYQTMYQQRRLGALNMEWHQPSRHFAVGNDISFGQEYQLLPLADLDRMIEPLPEFLDAMHWEPENEVISDDTDSEYNVTEEYFSGNERVSLGGDSSSEIECSAEDSGDDDDEKDSLRRSRRNKQKAEVDLMTYSGRRVKRRMLDENDGTFSGGTKTKKSRNGTNSSKQKASKAKSSRPQRAAARNARSMFSQLTGTSTNGGDDSEEDTSDSESAETEQPTIDVFEETVKPRKLLGSQGNIGKRRLIVKLSIPEPKKPLPIENASQLEEVFEDGTSLRSNNPESSAVDPIDAELSQNPGRSPQIFYDHMETCKGDKEVAICILKEASAESHADDDFNKSMLKEASPYPESSGVKMLLQDCIDEEQPGTRAKADLDFVGKMELINPSSELGAYHSHELEVAPPPKATKIRFKLKNLPKDDRSPSKLKIISTGEKSVKSEIDWDRVEGYIEKNTPNVSNYNDARGTHLLESSDAVRRTRSMGIKAMGTDLLESSSDAVRTTRSMGLKATLRQESVGNIDFKVREGRDMVGTSRNAESISMRAADEDLFEEMISSLKVPARLRSARNTGSTHYKNDPSSRARRKSNHPVRKLSWLMLTEHEESYRYIPQLGDTVVYLKQGHEEYMKTRNEELRQPWTSVKNAVEIFTVKSLNYMQLPGSGESCCKIQLKCRDPSSSVFGKTFELTLSESINFPDFVVEKTRYDDSLARNWSPEEKCQVWWRAEDGGGGKWWEGRIISSEAKSRDFPDSPWERYDIMYEDEPTIMYKHSPWELHDGNDPWVHPHIESHITEKLITSFARLEESDDYGIQTLNQDAERLDYLNRFAVPLYPEVIKLRIENRYYRSIKAVEHDMKIVLSNAEAYYPKNYELLSRFRHLSKRFRKTLSKLNVD